MHRVLARLYRDRGGDAVLTDLSLSVDAGEVLGLLGHNGAGKTTAIRLLNGLLRPYTGTVRVFGRDPVLAGPVVRSRVGVVLEDSGADERHTARGHLTFFAAVYGLRNPAAARRVGEVLELLGLAERADDRVAGFSRGMRQRLALCRALLPEPDVLYLDEPTAGLDPVATMRLRDVIRAVRARGACVVLASHDLAEVGRLCDRVVILRQGRMVVEGPPDQLAGRPAGGLAVAFDVGSGEAERAGAVLAGLPMIRDVGTEGDDRVTCRAERRDAIAGAVSTLVGARFSVYGVAAEPPDLETVYLSLHEEGAR
jgi:ABC-type multidrug transport system ATPase subunit